jgi:tRNA-uridine 2-sulfurtransferase
VLVVVQGHDHPLLASEALTTGPMHWLIGPRHEPGSLMAQPKGPMGQPGGPMGQPFRCTAKVRYRQADQAALFQPRPDGTARIIFDQPQRAVTPGQYAVVYDGDRCLGGAVIETVASSCAQPAAA